jgi:hypothetical protein
MLPLPQFLHLVKQFEVTVVNKTKADMTFGLPAKERRAIREAYNKAKHDLEMQIMSIY